MSSVEDDAFLPVGVEDPSPSQVVPRDASAANPIDLDALLAVKEACTALDARMPEDAKPGEGEEPLAFECPWALLLDVEMTPKVGGSHRALIEGLRRQSFHEKYALSRFRFVNPCGVTHADARQPTIAEMALRPRPDSRAVRLRGPSRRLKKEADRAGGHRHDGQQEKVSALGYQRERRGRRLRSQQ